MNLFAIFAAEDPQELDKRIPKVFEKSFQVGPGQWLIAFESHLPNEVYSQIKEQGGDIQCIVVSSNIYYGWKDSAIWKWLEEVSFG